MLFDSTPNGARCAYAMSQVVQAFDDELARDYLAVAIECARSAGIFSETGRVPAVLARVDVLRTAFLDGMDTCADLLGDDELLAQSPWKFSGKAHQTRYRIIAHASLFRVEVEIVFIGGDREVIEVGYFPTLAAAERQAEMQESVWHDLPEPSEAEMARFQSNLALLSADLATLPPLRLAA
jgi:hypothetical protein